MTTLRKFLADDHGATAIEYALIAGFVSVAIVAGAMVVGTKLAATFNAASSGLGN